MINLKLRGTIIRDLQQIEKMVKSLPQLTGQLKLKYSGVGIDDWDDAIEDLPFSQAPTHKHYVFITDNLTVVLLLG